MNPLIALWGVTELRCNGGPVVPVRQRLRLVGLTATDDQARKRTVCERLTVVPRVRLDATVDVEIEGEPELDYWVNSPDPELWFGMSPLFDIADEVYVTTVVPGVRFAGFRPRPADPLVQSTARKTLTNAGAHSFRVYNFRLLDDVSDYDDPGMVQTRGRVVGPGETIRLVWDPVGQRWLVNDGLYSAQYVTWESELVTWDDAAPVTWPEE